MKTIQHLGCGVLLLLVTEVANATDVQVNSTVAPDCTINAGTSSAIDLTGAAVNSAVAGVFEYQCNFAGGNTLINIKSQNGGLLNGPDLVDYGIFLNNQTPAAVLAPLPTNWLAASNATGAGVPFPNIVTPAAPNTPQFPYFYVGLREPALYAGNYYDLLTITISP